MFKKMKDKITEEVKIPSAKFTQSMQQLAQAVLSPSSSNNASVDQASNDNFSIGGDFDDTPQNSPTKNSSNNEGGVAYRGGIATSLGVAKDTGAAAGFTLVDLQQDSTPQKAPPTPGSGLGILGDAFNSLRRSSVTSSASDSSFMFPVLESPGPSYNFQSDLESCSEASESVGPNVNKEQLLQAYQKTQQRYQKYKGRYADLARHYRELERENSKAKNILAECQDKALRRMSELKEQCLLEKQAKAHLEEALRSDLEEKDHLIHTLETKIKLLKTSVDQSPQGEQTSSTSGVSTQGNSETSAEVSPLHSGGQEDLLSSGGEGTLPVSVLAPEPVPPAPSEAEQVLKEKVKKLEILLLKCREDITSKSDSIKNLESEKLATSRIVEELQNQLSAVQKREEEASLSLAKNKLSIHRELEAKEEDIKKLSTQLTSALSRITELQSDIVQIKEDSKKDLVAGKQEATRLLQAEMQQLVMSNQSLEDTLAARDKDVAAKEAKAAQIQQQLKDTERELAQLKHEKQKEKENDEREITSVKAELARLQECQGIMNTNNIFPARLRSISDSLHELRSMSKEVKSSVANLKNEAHDSSKLCFEKVLSHTSRICAQEAQKVESICAERNTLKCDLDDAKCSLEDLNEKVSSLGQSLTQEKADVTARICVLESELVAVKADKENTLSELERVKDKTRLEISSLKEQLNISREFEEEANKKLETVNQLLINEQNKLHKDVSTLEVEIANLSDKLKVEEHQREELDNQIGLLEARNSEMVEQYNAKEAQSLELIDQMNVMVENLSKKDEIVCELQASLSELKVSQDAMSASLVEKRDLECAHEVMLTEQKKCYEKISKLEKEICDLQGQLKASERDSSQYSHALEEIDILGGKVKSMEEKIRSLVSENASLLLQLSEKSKLIEEQETILADLHDMKETLQQSLEKLNMEVDDKSKQLNELRSLCDDQHGKLLESSDLSYALVAAESELMVKSKHCQMLDDDFKSLKTSLSEQENLVTAKANEIINLNNQIETLRLENMKKTSHIETLLESQLVQEDLLKNGSQECVKLQAELDQLKEEKSRGVGQKSKEEDLKLLSKLETENANLQSSLKSKTTELESLTNQLSSFERKFDLESQLVKEKNNDYTILASKLDMVTAENVRLTDLLKQKVNECEEKEAQLDNLAVEMKMVEELSQELHHINDDRDANVEMLSNEASSLAQKVEELTVSTQEMKEREVQLLSKLEQTEDIEKEYFALKSTLDQVKDLETELKSQLQSKSNVIKDLEEENERLKEAGRALPELVARAKEAEAKCGRLQEDGASLLSRIQKAEEIEMKCVLLEEELTKLREENKRLQDSFESHKENISLGHNESLHGSDNAGPLDGNLLYSKEPVIEVPCVVQHFSDLTEDRAGHHDEETITDGEKMWESKYLKLLEEYKTAMNNSEVIEKLREEKLMYAKDCDTKPKQRLWDRQDDGTFLGDERNDSAPAKVERLQQQLANATTQLKEAKKQHRQEVGDLRRILLNHGSGNSHSISQSDNLEDATELEYLRNILFEYMMGKEPLVLARVIAAVVKFDSDQTHKVLQKEQQRLSLLGQLGIS